MMLMCSCASTARIPGATISTTNHPRHRTLLFPKTSVTLLINPRVGWRAFHSLMEHGHTLSLDILPQKPLEQTSQEERRVAAALIARVASLPGFAASVATKVLH